MQIVSEGGADPCPPHLARLTSCRLPSWQERQRLGIARRSGSLGIARLRAGGRSSTLGRSSSGAFGRRRGSDLGGRFRLLGTRRMDRHDHRIALGNGRNRDTLGQRQVGQMLGLVHVHLREIQLDELGQILRQARDLHIGDAVRDHATLRLHARRGGLALEVDRDVDADLLGLERRAACPRARWRCAPGASADP